MQEIRSENKIDKATAHNHDRRRDILFLSLLVPLSAACFAAFLMGAAGMDGLRRTVFLLIPMIAGGIWLAYEQMHDLVWWSIHPMCATCRRSYAVWEKPKPGMICDCCDKPLYPLQTPQDYKVIILVTAITVVGLPVFALWASLINHWG